MEMGSISWLEVAQSETTTGHVVATLTVLLKQGRCVESKSTLGSICSRRLFERLKEGGL